MPKKHIKNRVKGCEAAPIESFAEFQGNLKKMSSGALKKLKESMKRKGIMNDKMSSEQFYAFLHAALSNMIRATDGALYVCMASSELVNLKRAFEDAGGHWQSFIVWVKNTFTLSRADYQNQYEPILYGWPKEKKNHYFKGTRNEGNVWEPIKRALVAYDGEYTTIKLEGCKIRIKGEVEGEIVDEQRTTDIWRENKPTKSDEHPTMKPIALVARALWNSSQRGEIVLDGFGGSGSTLIAAEQTGRKCYAMELDPKYVDVIVERWEKHTGEKAKKL